MIKKQSTIYGIVGLAIGIIGGIAGAAFSMGAEKQRINDILIEHSDEIEFIKITDIKHEESVQREMDRYVATITAQTIQLQDSIKGLTTTVYGLRADVRVIMALIERIEEDLNDKPN